MGTVLKRMFEPELVHLTDTLARLRAVAKKRKLKRRELIRFGAIKARLKAYEVALRAAARKDGRKGWSVKVTKKIKGKTYRLSATRSQRFNLAYRSRRNERGGRAEHYEKDAGGGGDGAAAVKLALSQVGARESPYGSNWGTRVSKFIRKIGWSSPIPWCGAFIGWVMKSVGVDGVTSRVASVNAIYHDARAGRGGFARLVPKSQAQPGDAVGLFSINTHVGMVVRNKGSYLETVEGNTSSGSGGSQSNGGGVFRRRRSMGDVVYVARPRYKKRR